MSDPRAPSVVVVVPGYNVVTTIADVLQRLSPATLSAIDEVVFVDNRSTDGTLDAVRRLQAGSGALARRLTVISNDANYGLGGSLKIGFLHAIDRRADYLIVIHSDKQGDSETIAADLLASLSAVPRADFVMASRFMPGARLAGYSRLRILGNHVFNALTFVLTGVWMTDAGCGIMAVSTGLLGRVRFLALSENFLFNPQLNILIHAAPGARVMQVPLTWSDAEVPSNLRVWRYLSALTRTLVQYRLNRWRMDEIDARALEQQARARLTYQIWAAPAAAAAPARHFS